MKRIFLLFAVASASLFTFPIVTSAQAPDLGTAANFVLFSTNGALSNTGRSYLTGNVGTNNGAVTGFGNVNGVMHNSDGTTAEAKTDLLIAYAELNTATPTFVHAPLLGNGDTLQPGVYSISGNTVLNLDLILDGNGSPGAVFIFQIGGTLSTNTASQIKMINGTQACNVFWKVEGLVSMASGTSMKGTVIANNAAIDMGTDVSLEGRALAIIGAVSPSNISAYTPLGCGSPVLTGPAAPDLASIACYAIFTGNESVANAGVSYVKGDVGTNAGLTTGFDSLNVNGKIHKNPDASTANAASDLLDIYSYLNSLSPDIQLLFPGQFGHSLVLTPHTYMLQGATALTDTLFLNAQGNADAVFVIKINGALSTSTYATVVLMNGAQASNVFWKVDGAVSLNNYSKIKGTIVCNNGAVELKTGVELEGRALTTNGALSTSAVVVNVPEGTCSIMEPVITSNSGDATASVNVDENSTAVTTVTSTFAEGNAITYTLSGGADQSKFTINSSTGDLTFVAPPDFEAPTDADENNMFEVMVRATDNETGKFDEQALTVTVTDISEVISSFVSDLTPCPGTEFTVTAVIPGTFANQTHQFTVLLSDSTGSFTSPTVIGNLETELDGNNNIIGIPALLPYTAANGNGYRVEVVSSTLTAYSSADNGQNMEILRARIGADRIISKCAGSAFNLTTVYKNNGYTYEWNTPNPESVTQPGLYTLTVTSANGCSVSANVVIGDFAKPAIGNDTTVRTSSSKFDLTTVYNTAGLSTRWNAADPTAAPSGRYRLIVSNEGCKDTAIVKVIATNTAPRAEGSVFATDKSGLADGKLHAVIYPNPAKAGSKLQVSGSAKGYTVTISDMSGKEVWRSRNAFVSEVSLPIERLARGVYAVTVISGTEIKTLRLIKE